MKKALIAFAAAATLAVSTMSAPTPAEARNNGGAVAAGIIGGLAAGAIIGSAANGYYGGGPYYGYGYAPGPVYYGPSCYWTRERYWNGWRWRSHRIRVCR